MQIQTFTNTIEQTKRKWKFVSFLEYYNFSYFILDISSIYLHIMRILYILAYRI